jgi:hypothetical protein
MKIFFSNCLEELTLGCKLNCPHSAPEGSFDLPPLHLLFPKVGLPSNMKTLFVVSFLEINMLHLSLTSIN